MHGKKHPSKTYESRGTYEPQAHSQLSEWEATENQLYYHEQSNGHRYYAERYDGQGNVEGVWNSGAQTGNGNPYTPRGDAPIEQLTADIGSLSVNPGGHSQRQAAQFPNQGAFLAQTNDLGYTIDSHFRDNHDGSHPRSQPQRDKGKAKAGTDPHHIYYDRGPARLGFGAPATNPPRRYDYNTYPNQTMGPEPDLRAAGRSFPISSPQDNANTYYAPSNTDDELQQALRMSRNQFLGNSRDGEPSSVTQYDTGTIYPGTYEPNTGGPQDGEMVPHSHAIPTQLDYTNMRIGAQENTEYIDNRFVVENSSRFQPGEVFKILWSEPKGQVGSEFQVSDRRAINGPTGSFYVGYRRFIIVTTDESHHSTCVPILTYDRRGCSKKGVRPDKHGIIYALGQRPKLLKDEPDLGFRPVPLKIYADGETLARESRVNYSKLVTIEHNVNVFFIGRIPETYFENVQTAVDQCWNEKRHKAHNKSRR
ncbi:hypothetical protein F4861DRAFT_361302 [Xylaria intraflava]|nr:hypothetical protein F4861DRAFT_361302 [Xylaria intraflava]